MEKTAIFLGAGASKAEGAPLQGELFHEYFTSPGFKDSKKPMDQELREFFLHMFKIDVKQDDTSTIVFPTFEEVLALIDLAILRKEAFRNFEIENRAENSGRLRLIGQYLVFLVAKVLHEKLQGNSNIHRELVQVLHKKKVLRDIVFVSTNYDILIDNALTELYKENIDLDYGVEFSNFNHKYDWRRPRRNKRVELFKPHGSLNWLFCPTCNELKITPKEKGVVTHLISKHFDTMCPECRSVYIPLIVPPTFYKDLNNVFLSTIWNRTDIALRKVDHIIFCGYSFPDSDIHIKYLLKRAQTNRTVPLKFTVINHFSKKPKTVCKDEKNRYMRFLGSSVNYTNKSFEDFAYAPFSILR